MSRKPRRQAEVQTDTNQPVAWFPGPDDSVTLPLPGGQSIDIRPELDAVSEAGLLEGLRDGVNVAAALDTYRGFVNGYLQAALKRRSDPVIREHLETIAETILKALR